MRFVLFILVVFSGVTNNSMLLYNKKPTFSWFSFQTLSIFLSGKLIPYIRCSESLSVSPNQLVAECLVAAKAFTFPVFATWGPLHKSIKLPHLYTVVRVPSGTLVVKISCLNGLSANSSKASSLVTTILSNFCFCFTILATSASTGLSIDRKMKKRGQSCE
jgi:hypothetical protein